MQISEPYVHIRKPHYHEMAQCCKLARDNWGNEAADRCREQFIEHWKGGRYAPTFVVAVTAADDGPILGFAAYHRTMLMKGAFDLIWVAVDPEYQGSNVGRALTNSRLTAIDEEGGQMIQLVTQKPDYFAKFGFFKLHHLGNEWYLMIKLLTNAVEM
jgi:predicted N-acetyltransferase YhbS